MNALPLPLVREIHERGPDRRVGSAWALDGRKLTVVACAAAAFLIALVTYLLVVGDRILKPLVIAILVWHLINGMVNALARVSQRIRIRGRVLPRSVRFFVASA